MKWKTYLASKLSDQASFHKIRHYKGIDGFLSRNEALGLYRTASLLGINSTAVEIGSWKGKSTYCIARGLKEGKLIAIDPFDASGDAASEVIYSRKRGEKPLLQQFKSKMNKLRVLDKIEIYQGYSQDFAGLIKNIDFLFIDADHSIDGCNSDFIGYADSVKVGGYIAFHDYDPLRKDLGPTWVINNKVIPSEQYAFDGLYDSLWIGKKVK